MTRFESKSINLVLMQIVGPALIIFMVSSLVFFLIEIFYRGPHTARLYWIMGLFTFAAVLVSRISVEEGRERAQLFGLALAAATLISCMQIVTFSYAGLSFLGPVVATGLIVVVMWSSSKLTWDCTVVDRSRDASATGLVDIFRKRLNLEANEETTREETSTLEKIVRWLSGGHQKNTPGIWVFYFAIFAFPVFGLGQWFVEAKSKTWVFLLFAVYLGSTLCLLMTTSLLGLERYLAKRNLHVPAPVARNWMIVGTSFATIMVLLVLLVPKPATSNHVQNWLSALTSPERKTSKLAAGKDGQKDTPEAKKQQQKEDAERQVEGDKGKGGEKNKGGDGESDDQDSQGESKSDSKKQSKDANQPKNKNSKQSEKSEQSKNQQRNNENQQNNRPADSKNNQDNQKNNRQQKNVKPPKERPDQGNKPQQQEQSDNQLSQIFEQISKGIRWLVYAVGFVAGCFLIWMFKDEIAKLFAAIFGRKKTADSAEPIVQKTELEKPPASYRSFNDPFRSGKVNSLRASQVLEYTREALEAWSREAGIDTQPDSTLEELAREIKGIDPQVSSYAKQFAEVYSRSAFSQQKVSREELNPLIKLWRSMDRAYAQMKRPRQSVANS